MLAAGQKVDNYVTWYIYNLSGLELSLHCNGNMCLSLSMALFFFGCARAMSKHQTPTLSKWILDFRPASMWSWND